MTMSSSPIPVPGTAKLRKNETNDRVRAWERESDLII